MTTSAAALTLAGTDYDPIDFTAGGSNTRSPAWSSQITVARGDLVANLTPLTNLVTNPSASVDLTGAVGTSCTVTRQAPAQGFGNSHSTAYRLTGTNSAFGQLTVGGGAGGMRLGMVAGKKYTLSATFYIDVAMAGTANAYARSIVVNIVDGGVQSILASSVQAANTGGKQTRLSVTFTVPRTASAVWAEFYHGHASTSVCYWTDLLLVEGDGIDTDGQPVQFFDGDTIGNALYLYAWTGAAGKSSSTRALTFSNGKGPVVDPRLYPPARLRWWYGDDPAPILLDLYLTVRSYVPNDVDGTVSIGLMSDEIRLQDYKNAATADYAPGAMLLTDMVAYAMRKIGNPPIDMTGIPAVTIPATATVWKAGDSLDSWLQGPLRANGVELYQDAQDPARTWRAFVINTAGKATANGLVALGTATDILSAPIGIDMDAPDYADAVVTVYQWTDAAGASQRKVYASLPPGAFHRVLTQTFSTPDPGVDPTPATRAFTSKAGWVGDLEVLPQRTPLPPSYALGPMRLGDSVRFTLDDASTYLANAQTLTWRYPNDTMTIGLTNTGFTGIISPF